MTTETIDTRPFLLSGEKVKKTDLTFLQDAGRGAVPLATYTIVSKVSASQKLVPLTNVAAITGDAVPYGIFIGDPITGSALVAGDVIDQSVFIVGKQSQGANDSVCQVDEDLIVLENSLTLETVVSGEDQLLTIRDWLERKGIYPVATTNQNVIQPIN